MPPASPPATLVDRMASRSEVLPWSTWPMMVTTGGRGYSMAGSSALSNRPSSTSDSATRRTEWPSSSAMSWAVSASIVSVILAIWPCFIRSLITSTARSDIRLASSWMVITSGILTSRTSFSLGSWLAWPLSRWVRRRNDATERSRSSSAVSAVTSVSRPRHFFLVGLLNEIACINRRGRRPGVRRGSLLLRFVVAETLFGLRLRLAFSFLVVAATLLFFAFARLTSLALGALGRFSFLAPTRGFLGEAPLLGLVDFRLRKRMGAGRTLFLGQLAQHDAGRLAAGSARRRCRDPHTGCRTSRTSGTRCPAPRH